MRVFVQLLVLVSLLSACAEWCPTRVPELLETSDGYNVFQNLADEDDRRSVLSLSGQAQAGEGAPADGRTMVGPIRPHTQNASYWEYKGRLTYLLGGSKNDNLFQSDSLEEHLDLLTSVGGNYVRNTMSSRDPGDLWAFHRLPDGRYDLAHFNTAYFQRVEKLLKLAIERDIIVQIELWDRFDFGPPYAGSTGWEANPYRPANNVNYTTDDSGLANTYLEHPNTNENPFFRSIPAQDNNAVLLEFQQAQVDRLLEVTLRYPNVLYAMDNETSASAQWGAYWSNYVKKRAEEAGAEVYTTEMWDAWDLKDEQHRHTLDHPDLYAFADISQNNQNTNQEHWDNLQWARRYTADHPRPLNHVKIYGADTGTFGTTQDGLERFWRSLIGGAASVRFHRPPSGIGLTETPQAHLRSARMFLEAFDLQASEPDAESSLLSDRSQDEAYMTYDAGRQYAVYFTDGGDVKLDLCDTEGTFDVRWLDLSGSVWHTVRTVEGGAYVQLRAPEIGHWLAVVTKSTAASDDGEPAGDVGDHVLEPNYPNPFSSDTTIRYALPKHSFVRLSVFDMLGRLIKVVVSARQRSGSHQVEFRASGLPSGTYYYQLEAQSVRMKKKMTLLR